MNLKENCNRKKRNQGQALFEFLIFTPLFLGLMSLLISIAGAINGGINQEKAIRGYTFNILKGNPNGISARDMRRMNNKANIGFFAIGFQEKEESEKPVATCYRLHMFGASSGESCDSSKANTGKTQYVRVMNLFGLCGATYQINASAGEYQNMMISAGNCSVSD